MPRIKYTLCPYAKLRKMEASPLCPNAGKYAVTPPSDPPFATGLVLETIAIPPDKRPSEKKENHDRRTDTLSKPHSNP